MVGLDLDRGTERTHVGFMGCHGALNGLLVARAFAASDPEAQVVGLRLGTVVFALLLPLGSRKR